MALFIFQKENPLHSTIPYNSNIYANKCISWLPTVTSSVSVFVCNCLTDVSFMDFVRKHGNAPWTPPWKGNVITSSLHPHILKWVSKFTSHGLLRIYRKKHTSSVALPLMIPHGNQHVSTSWRSHLVPMTTFHTID